MTQEIKPGEVYEVPYPFILEPYTQWDEEGPSTYDTWRPGTRSEPLLPDSCEGVADAMGSMILTVVDIHAPVNYSPRVFFTRKWRDPRGNVFGKNDLRILGIRAFRNRLAGFAYGFRLKGEWHPGTSIND